MPRLKPPPGRREEEDLNKDLEVDLEPVEGEGDDTEILATDTDEQKEAKREAAREYRQKKKEEEEARNNENATLKQQLEDMRKAMEETKRLTAEAQRRQAEIEARAAEQARENSRYLSRAEEAEYQAVLTAMSAAESEAESAQRDLVTAQTNGDFQASADAQRRLSRAEAKMVSLEDNKNELEHRKNMAIARAEEEKNRRPAPQNLSVEQQIDSNTALMPSQKEWLKSHPDAWTDQRKNMRLQGAHVEAEDQGLVPGTKAYFDYLDVRLGYKKAEAEEVDDEEDEAPPPRRTERRTLVSAPVSRAGATPSGKPSSRTKITLTPKQQEAAAIAGIDPQTYAQNLLKFEALKEDGYYSD